MLALAAQEVLVQGPWAPLLAAYLLAQPKAMASWSCLALLVQARHMKRSPRRLLQQGQHLLHLLLLALEL